MVVYRDWDVDMVLAEGRFAFRTIVAKSKDHLITSAFVSVSGAL